MIADMIWQGDLVFMGKPEGYARHILRFMHRAKDDNYLKFEEKKKNALATINLDGLEQDQEVIGL